LQSLKKPETREDKAHAWKCGISVKESPGDQHESSQLTERYAREWKDNHRKGSYHLQIGIDS
jgi:hypothetical protein